jgi:hypothetical protein
MSVTKGFVGLAIGWLLEEKKIASLDSPLATWFPEWKEGKKARVTLRHVVTHTSGLSHQQTNKLLAAQRDRLAYVRALPIETEPGEVFSYSNEATQLLSGIDAAVRASPRRRPRTDRASSRARGRAPAIRLPEVARSSSSRPAMEGRESEEGLPDLQDCRSRSLSAAEAEGAHHASGASGARLASERALGHGLRARRARERPRVPARSTSSMHTPASATRSRSTPRCPPHASCACSTRSARNSPSSHQLTWRCLMYRCTVRLLTRIPTLKAHPECALSSTRASPVDSARITSSNTAGCSRSSGRFAGRPSSLAWPCALLLN